MKVIKKLVQKIYCYEIKTVHHLTKGTATRTVIHKVFGFTIK